MPPKKVTRKQLLKEPDEFITFSGKLIQALNQYRIQIVGGLIAVLVLLAAIGGYRYYVHQSEAQASFLLSKVKKQYAALLQDGDARSAYQAVKSDMDDLIQKYGNRGSGKLARILIGDFSYRAEKYDDAEGYYEQAQGSFPEAGVYANRILSSLAYTCLAKNDSAKARRYFEKVAASADALLSDEVLFNLATLADKGETPQEAKAYWDRIAGDHADSIFNEIAKDKRGEPEA